MKTIAVPWRYTVAACRPDLFWFPAALWALFAIITGLMWGRDDVLSVAHAFLGYVLPLLGGILAGSTVLDDSALELRFATPHPAWVTLLERLGLVLTVLAAAAFSYQIFLALLGVDLSDLGNLGMRQLAWLIPGLALMALGSASALLVTQSMGGSLLVGLMWIFQVITRGWFISHPTARYFCLFLGATDGFHPALRLNQLTLGGLTVLLLLGAWALLRRQERYL